MRAAVEALCVVMTTWGSQEQPRHPLLCVVMTTWGSQEQPRHPLRCVVMTTWGSQEQPRHPLRCVVRQHLKFRWQRGRNPNPSTLNLEP